MRILLTHATCWPHVRRGTERNMEVWYDYLNRTGHDAHILSSVAPGIHGSAEPNKHLLRRRWRPWMSYLRLTPAHTFPVDAWSSIPAIDPDVVHSYYFYDSLAGSSRGSRNYGTVLQLNGVAVPGVSCRRFLPPEATLMKRAVAKADQCIVCSEFVLDLLRDHLGGNGIVIPPPVDPALWPCGAGLREDPAVILAVGNFNERRKGLRPLFRAFELLRLEGRNLRLRISGTLSDGILAELLASLDARFLDDVEYLGLGKPGDLPALYQSASVLALPAMWEPSGTVMMEAWLSGTPVVAARHGGLPEFFTNGVGFLFDPKSDGEEASNIIGLAEALDNAIRLRDFPQTRARCREHGETFSPAAVGPRYLGIYRQVARRRVN